MSLLQVCVLQAAPERSQQRRARAAKLEIFTLALDRKCVLNCSRAFKDSILQGIVHYYGQNAWAHTSFSRIVSWGVHAIQWKLQLEYLYNLPDLGHGSQRWPSQCLRFWLPTACSFLNAPWHPLCLPLTVRKRLGNTKESKYCQQVLLASENILPDVFMD